MPTFRQQSAVVEAIQYDGFNAVEIAGFAGPACHIARGIAAPVFLDTPAGTMRVDVGDWIIRGGAGAFHRCKADRFAATYEPLER